MFRPVCKKVNKVVSKANAFILHPHEAHIWYASVVISEAEEKQLLSLLSKDEIMRAERFRFPIHKTRFIAARGLLRKMLGAYLNQDPETIVFAYSPRGKPYLEQQSLQFNVSHSHDLAAYAFTRNYPIGIDIEKNQDRYDEAVAERFFSATEYAALSALPLPERASCFYRIWSRKEALIKVSGEGFAFALSSFTVPTEDSLDTFQIAFHGESGWLLQSFIAHPDYQSAFATQQKLDKTLFRAWPGFVDLFNKT